MPWGADQENVQQSVGDHFFFILLTQIFDTGVILQGEIRCWSHTKIKGFNTELSQVLITDLFVPFLKIHNSCNKMSDLLLRIKMTRWKITH